MENQTLLIDDQPSKVLWNAKWNGIFLESFWGEILSRNKVQLLDLASRLWPTLIKLFFARTIQDHYDFMLKNSRPCLSFSSRNYFWFMQYMNNDDGDLLNARLPLGIHSKSFHLILVHNFDVNYYVIIWFHSFVLSFACSCLCLLFTDYMTMFVTLKGRKQCPPLIFLFQDDVDLIAYLTVDHPKSFKKRRN
jgi:hypothetical protein